MYFLINAITFYLVKGIAVRFRRLETRLTNRLIIQK